jgi:hypothetical protein
MPLALLLVLEGLVQHLPLLVLVSPMLVVVAVVLITELLEAVVLVAVVRVRLVVQQYLEHQAQPI